MMNSKTNQKRRPARGMSFLIAVVMTATLLAVGQNGASATHLTVTSAFGYWADGISLFGGAQADTGPTPRVALAANASNSPQNASAPTGRVTYGPAKLFTSDAITVGSSGSVGPSGSVTSTSNIQNINNAATQADSGSEVFGYPTPEPPGSPYFDTNPTNLHTSVAGTATASSSGVSGSTTVTNGMVRTHKQASDDCTKPWDVNPCGRAGEEHTHSPTDPEGVVTIPTNPPPNYKVTGHLHLGTTVSDYFVIVFNERTTNPDGSITVTPVHQYFGYKLVSGQIVDDPPSILHGHLYLGRVVAGTALAQDKARDNAPADFNDDGYTDISVFRPSNSTWFIRNGATVGWGTTGDRAVPADYDGDGDADVAVFRPSNGIWYVSGGATTVWGTSGDIPVPADYDGDGDADVAVYRPSQGVWYINGGATVAWGTEGDIPVPGDYDGNGTADIAVYRPSQGVWYVRNGTTAVWGTSGDIPVPGNYDLDAATDVAVFRPSTGVWYIQGGPTTVWGLGRGPTTQVNDGHHAAAWGTSGDIPVPGNYAGDNRLELAVFRPSTGVWYIQGGTSTAWGGGSDKPLPLPEAVRSVFFP